MLESAIQTKKITWEDAERVTSIPEQDLKERLSGVIDEDENKMQGKEEHPATVRFAR